MKRQITSFLLVMVMLLGLVPAGIFGVRAESAMVTSDACIELLKLEEGFSRVPYWDFAQYTVGYGTRCPDDMVAYYMQNGITEEEAEVLLRNHLAGFERDINQRIIDEYGLTLTQNQFDAIVMFSYNCGTAWAYEPEGTFHQAIATGATGNDIIRAFALWCSAGGEIRTYLLRRRLCEVNMYVNGVYSQTPPDNYCYVVYDANGGVSSPRSQGYDSDLTAEPFPVPTYTGYTFQGWFTAKTGGTQVTVLDATTKSMTLYAQWLDDEGNPPSNSGAATEKPIVVTVTATDVNLRNGPGTNHTVVGTADKGQQFTITETATGSGYNWGKFDGGWIALEFTDYETVMENQPDPTDPTEPEETEPEETEPEETEPEETEPEETEPEETEPEETEPEETEPEVTEPEETEPEETQPEQTKVYGTANVQDWLRVRAGPGTSYAVTGYLKPNERVEILEQKVVGTQKWGKISTGWVSMDYIVLEKNEPSGGNTETTPKPPVTVWTGKVDADELRVRSGPGTSYSIVGFLTDGTAVTITERKTVGNMEWGKISNGWISLDYVKLDADNSDSGSTTTPPEVKPEVLTGTVKVQDSLRVRTGPGTSYEVAGFLKAGEKVTITEQKTVGNTVWGKIESGWISMDYVELDAGEPEPTPPEPVIKTITADCLRVRSKASIDSAIVGYLYYGAKVEILETAKDSDGDLWGRTATGWIFMKYTK